ncbi:MAG: type II secretion system protein [Candidatus Gracilibacteria bacterium]|nr:type II secretion system protein [Candidatus Gracilibacteria bacterium]
MVTQKTQTSMNVKGFTLVELIVVITILVILGTIAFLNLGGMSASARDSQRTSDLNQINTQIMTSQAKSGMSYINMVSSGAANQLNTLSIAGTGVTPGAEYTAGDVNYTVLGIDSAKFKDPIKAVAYKMGATSLAGTAYQLAATLEETNTALVMGTYRARTAADTASGTVLNSIITLESGFGVFKVGDVLTDGTHTGSITSISADLTRITLDSTTLTATGAFALNVVESDGLISNNGTNVVTNKGTVLPY